MKPKLRIQDLDLRGKKVFIRVDYNVPLKEEGGQQVVGNDKRIRASLPTLQHALDNGASIVLASHLGRPKGKVNPKESLKPAAEKLASHLGRPVTMAPDCVGPEVDRLKAALTPGSILMLENLRFHPEEEKNEPGFARALVAGCDEYVDDAFGSAHRAHASVHGAAGAMKRAAMGILMGAEVEALTRVLFHPAKPFVALLGGAKVSDKIPILKNLTGRVDAMCIGGAMAYTFLKAKGIPVGASLVEDDLLATAKEILAEAESKKTRILLPEDHVVEAGARTTATLGATDKGLDIGPATRAAFAREIAGAKTIVWNGPVGMFETPPFDAGTRAVAEAIVKSGAFFVVGGGDSVSAVSAVGMSTKGGHVSTGGGAMLEFLAFNTLPGVEVLTDRPA